MINIGTIYKRSSMRSFSSKPLSKEQQNKVDELLKLDRIGPFGSKVNFSLINLDSEEAVSIGKLSSYGVITGANKYIGGYSKGDDNSIIDFGYCFEELILELTELGLGTCWLGGTFGRSFVAKILNLPEGFIIPAISPIGLALEKRVLTDKIVRFVAKSNSRKKTRELYFSLKDKTIHGLDEERIDKNILRILESVRVAPSASNKQPWRLVIDDNQIHLFWDFNTRYNNFTKDFNIQALDMGIAIKHIHISLKELGYSYNLEIKDPEVKNVEWKYISSFNTIYELSN